MVGGLNGIENGAWWVIIDEIRVGAQSHKKSRFIFLLVLIVVSSTLSDTYLKKERVQRCTKGKGLGGLF